MNPTNPIKSYQSQNTKQDQLLMVVQQLNNGPFNGEQVLIFDVQEGCQFCECRIAKEVASSCIDIGYLFRLK